MPESPAAWDAEEIVIAVYKGETRAAEVQQELGGLLGGRAMIFEMDAEGMVAVEGPLVKTAGTVLGALAGGLIGLLLGGPIGGVLIGGLVGNLAVGRRSKADKSELGDDLEELTLRELMTPDSSALVLQVRKAEVAEVVTALEAEAPQALLHMPEGDLAEALGVELD